MTNQIQTARDARRKADANTGSGLPVAERRSHLPGVRRLKDSLGNPMLRVVDAEAGPSYDVINTSHLFDCKNATLFTQLANAERVFTVLDPAINVHYGRAIRAYLRQHCRDHRVYVLPAYRNNEHNKSDEAWRLLHVSLMQCGIGPKDIILGVGGGVVADLVGFTASTLRRGCPYVLAATTLTAMIDAAISPKTAINVGGFKNSCGTYYAAQAVLCDTSLIRTDPALKTGIAEMIKLGVVRSACLFKLLESQGRRLLETKFQTGEGVRAIRLAQRLFLAMKFDQGPVPHRRASLRAFGHAFSRRLEELSDFNLSHGEAVALEMAIATNLACQAGVCSRSGRDRILAALCNFRLMTPCSRFTSHQIWQVFQRRADAGEPFLFPIPGPRIGQGTFLSQFSAEELATAVEGVRSNFARSAA